jgi:hypothetical protein
MNDEAAEFRFLARRFPGLSKIFDTTAVAVKN